ncbi:ubiquinone biosynthesis protein UbiA [Halobacteriales archaeon QS_7_69_60]|nr:MAG: ubiquinone biosynthesis protein UbiA [Halobacteriales archaeon QS_7_69_60]
MTIARHGRGVRADVSALASQVHPVFMLPPLAASAFGAVLADGFDAALLALHLTAVFAALYTAHIKDGYVDFYRRGEDDDHPLTAVGCRAALAGATLVFFACLLVIGVLVDVQAALLTLPGWIIGYLHAPQLDLNPVGATAGYPAGIAFALLGGYYVQAATLSATVRARRFAYGLMAFGMAAVVALALAGVFPPASVFAPMVFGVVAAFAWRAGEDASLATKLLIRGSYLFLAVLVAAVWFG